MKQSIAVNYFGTTSTKVKSHPFLSSTVYSLSSFSKKLKDILVELETKFPYCEDFKMVKEEIKDEEGNICFIAHKIYGEVTLKTEEVSLNKHYLGTKEVVLAEAQSSLLLEIERDCESKIKSITEKEGQINDKVEDLKIKLQYLKYLKSEAQKNEYFKTMTKMGKRRK